MHYNKQHENFWGDFYLAYGFQIKEKPYNNVFISPRNLDYSWHSLDTYRVYLKVPIYSNLSMICSQYDYGCVEDGKWISGKTMLIPESVKQDMKRELKKSFLLKSCHWINRGIIAFGIALCAVLFDINDIHIAAAIFGSTLVAGIILSILECKDDEQND